MHSENSPADSSGIDPEDLTTTLRVLESLHLVDPHHPDYIAVRQATAHMFKAAKQARRRELRAEVLEADQAVIAATATGAPHRIDDETQGKSLSSTTSHAVTAGTLRRAQSCYMCKQRFTQIDWFYHQLCPRCAAFSHHKRDARTDLTGRRALLTGGRAKIGMHIALRLLRDGANVTITTRFPTDAARRFMLHDESHQWLDRLTIIGIDLRDPAQVIRLADTVAAEGPLDIVINNAAQTVRRSPGAYAPLIEAESHPLPDGPRPRTLHMGVSTHVHPLALERSIEDNPLLLRATRLEGTVSEHTSSRALTATDVTQQALRAGSASIERHKSGTAIDAGGLVPDTGRTNSWTHNVGEIDPLELLEVQLCNSTAPFILIDRLRPVLAQGSARAASHRAYVVNVSAMEGVFGRRYKGPGHPHTNMSKAALNMVTRTSAEEMFETDQILMTSVDTGWITDERPHDTKIRLAEEGFHAPLDLVDGAARVYDPIVRGEAGEDLYGVFLKDYRSADW